MEIGKFFFLCFITAPARIFHESQMAIMSRSTQKHNATRLFGTLSAQLARLIDTEPSNSLRKNAWHDSCSNMLAMMDDRLETGCKNRPGTRQWVDRTLLLVILSMQVAIFVVWIKPEPSDDDPIEPVPSTQSNARRPNQATAVGPDPALSPASDDRPSDWPESLRLARQQQRMQREMDQMMRSVLGSMLHAERLFDRDVPWPSMATPALDMRDSPDHFTVIMRFPRIHETDIEISRQGQLLTIVGYTGGIGNQSSSRSVQRVWLPTPVAPECRARAIVTNNLLKILIAKNSSQTSNPSHASPHLGEMRQVNGFTEPPIGE